MSKRTQWFVLVLALVALMAAAALNAPAVYADLIDPIARVAWLLIRLLMMVDQEVYWILLIFTGFILAALMVPNRPEPYARARREEPSPSSDRVGSWKSLIESAGADPTARLALQHRLEELQKTIRARLHEDALEKTCTLAEEPADRSGGPAKFFRQTLRHWPWRQNTTLDPNLGEQINLIITSLETDLEISDDKSTEPSDRR